MSNDKFLQLENIYKTFPLPNGKEYKAVVDVNVNIKKNEIISIIGHSGCGKSTLLNMIAGLDAQTQGNIILNNKEVIKCFMFVLKCIAQSPFKIIGFCVMSFQ